MYAREAAMLLRTVLVILDQASVGEHSYRTTATINDIDSGIGSDIGKPVLRDDARPDWNMP